MHYYAVSEIREPLPYKHERRGVHAEKDYLLYACQQPERDNGHGLLPSVGTCPGCRSFAMATIMRDPHKMVRTSTGKIVFAVNRLRELVDPLDPMMVLFERELEVRHGSVPDASRYPNPQGLETA